MYQLKSTFGAVIHEGTLEECETILKAFIAYGISEHKFEIVESDVEWYEL
jgi:hypothetical protein